MNNQDQFHALLKERVEATRKDHETAIHLLREYERMFNVTGAQTRTTPTETRPAPQPRQVETETTSAKKTSTAPTKTTTARAAASARAAQPAKTKKKTTVKAKAASKKPAAVKAKMGAKASAKAKSRPGPKPNSRRENVPSLIKAIQVVMGRKTMNADQVYEALKARDWLPNSSDQLGYIRYTLSKHKEIFLRVEGKRGHYHLDVDTQTAAPKAEKKNGTAAKESAKTEAAPSSEAEAEVVNDVDELLKNSGVDLSGSNPFADQPAS